MTDPFSSPTHVRSALFVDFDNIYLGLQNEDPRAAEQFATHPGRWLRWLQEALPNDSRATRKILSRRCYLNPSQFSRFRPYFIRSAFEVVDCPPLTRGGKTSADIQMVMDIMDALGHATRFEEFIILSGDADFTPVLLRLSRHDRRSVVLAAGPASAAYKAACDVIIDQDTFLEEAIGISEGSPVRPGADSELLQRIAAKVYERAAGNGELVATDLPSIFREFDEFTPDSNWLGFYSLRGMTSAVVQARRDLEMLEGDPWRVRVRAPLPQDAGGAPESAAEGGEGREEGAEGPADRPERAARGGNGGDGGAMAPGDASGGGDAGAATGGGKGVGGGEGGGGLAAGGETAGNGGTARAGSATAGGRSAAAGASGTAGGGAGVGGTANGSGQGDPAGPPAVAPPQLLRAIADKVYDRASAAGELLATDLPGIYREFPQFTPTSNWLGFYSLRGLSDAVIRSRGDLQMADGDPWRVRLRPPQASAGGAGRETERTGAAGPAPAGGGESGFGGARGQGDPRAAAGGAEVSAQAPADPERQRQIQAIVDFVRSLVATSDSPVPTALAAHAVIDRFGEGVVASRWLGAATFRDLLAGLAGHGDLGFAISNSRPGFLYDPDLHQTPQDQAKDLDLGDPETTSLAHRIHRITDTPYLTSEEYALVFLEIAEEVNEEGYFLTRTSKAVRDRCIEEGAPIARTSVNFILRGITSAGYRFDTTGTTDPFDLASAFLKNVLGLCESAGMPLSDEEREQLTAWIVGGLPPPTPESAPAPPPP